jgi:hypothetical protein
MDPKETKGFKERQDLPDRREYKDSKDPQVVLRVRLEYKE